MQDRQGVVVARIILLSCLALICAEGFARFHLKWGQPSVYVAHPRIEYMLAPDQDVRPYGNRQLVNQYGMRSAAPPSDRSVRRYLVFGDSVLNGGLSTDHADLATTVLSDDRRFYGNISANSWGPANMAAWLEEFGDLDAVGAIVLISSHDAYDIPTFGDLDPEAQPSSRPYLAVSEILPKLASRFPLVSVAKAASNDVSLGRTRAAIGRAGLSVLLDELDQKDLPVCLIQHQTVTELKTKPGEGWLLVQQAFGSRKATVVQLADWTGPAAKVSPEVFADDIHMAPEGQRLIAEAIKACTRALEGRAES
jgi:hypothetical protein